MLCSVSAETQSGRIGTGANFLSDNDLPGFRVGASGNPRDDRGAFPPDPLAPFKQGWLGDSGIQPRFDEARIQQAYVTGGEGGSGGLEWCRLMPNIQQFGFCLYLCPDGGVKRLDRSNLGAGCQPSILPHQGIGL
jgi:hypothetical protein